ncbi:MAG: TonB-dependent receptor [Pseudomonadota bacterium]
MNRINNSRNWLVFFSLTFVGNVSNAEEMGTDPSSKKNHQDETIYIIGSRNVLPTEPGSAFVIYEDELEKYEYNDLQRILRKVPGVYFRDEDGYGLRPNIGIRGAAAERSQKIVLMEDGILIAPAAYAAPSAYYMPLMTRMVGVEVLKGPASIQHGPNTVGGAINLVSRSIPEIQEAMIDLGIGEDTFFKSHVYYGDVTEQFGWLIEGVHVQTDGFKDLEPFGDTGFDKNDFMGKFRWNTHEDATYYQSLELKLAYVDENSDETYLGLTDDDFEDTPNRRYAASQRDNMDWDRQQYQLTHFIDFNNGLTLSSKFYRSEFTRAWEKLNRFNTNRTLQTILAEPDSGLNSVFYSVLIGETDTSSSAETLLIGTNDRDFYTQGMDFKLSGSADWFDIDHDWQIGLRLHEDEIERNHTEDGFLMRSRLLVADGNNTRTVLQNRDYAESLAVFLQNAMAFESLTVTLGLRGEFIDSESTNILAGTPLATGSDEVLLPGIGVFYQLNDALGVLAGVNKGFVPNKPGQADVDPENSLNYELGLRFVMGETQGEVMGFFNDYENLLGICTFSAGCVDDVDREFNGGEVHIYGLEALLNHTVFLTESLQLPMSMSYTLTQTEFQTSFQSNFSQWGNVQEGDELPYVPENQLTFNIGLQQENWLLEVSAAFVDEMQETAGVTETPFDGLTTEAHWMLDLTANYSLNKHWNVYGSIENLTDTQDIVSRRPFGARPSKTRQAFAGIKYQF